MIPGTKAALGFISVLKQLGSDKPLDVNDTTLSTVGVDILSGDMTKLVSNFVIEPDIYFTSTLNDTEHLEDINVILGQIFVANYMKSFNIMVNVAGLEASTAFDLLSTKSTVSAYNSAANALSMLSHEDDEEGFIGLPIKDEQIITFEDTATISGKADPDDISKIITSEADVIYDVVRNGTKTKIVVPIMIKTIIRPVSFKSIITMVEEKGFLETLSGRFMEARSGGITWWNFFWPTDLAKKYKQNRLDTLDDMLESISEKELISATKLLTSGGRGMSLNYGMYVMTTRELAVAEGLAGLDMRKHKHVDEMLDKLRGMVIAVVDDDFGVVDFYIKNIKGKSSVKYSRLGKKKGGSSTDELIKALISNRPPQF